MWLAALGSLLLSERTKPGGSKVTDTFLATLGPAFPMTRSYLPMPANGVSAKRAYIIGRDRILLSFLADSRLAFAIHAVRSEERRVGKGCSCWWWRVLWNKQL